ncbi:MAG TPA: translation initiation factor IF-2 [Firmicutes bacterium]|nr:translation initiation factor IF-2 [Bacillota bacterium]
MRIYEFAKKLGIPTKKLLEICEKKGIKGKKGLSAITEEEIKRIEEFMGGEKEEKETVAVKKPEEEKAPPVEKKEENLIPRAPVVTMMGHVDHGKTTILDYIRKSRIAEKEEGQITQKIGAYKVNLPEGSIVFLDTPGHEAFTAMRAMGAKVTDIVVLVVAADEGVKPQTIEAINHARSANVPIIVAINKIDKPNANPDKVKQQLSEHNLMPEEWGGDTVYVNVSGITGEGIDELLEMILLVGEMMELKADPKGPAEGVVIESYLDKFKGPVITVIVQKGTLKVGDPFVAGETWGKVRALIDDWGNRIKEAGPSTPVEILGSHEVVVPGTKFKVVNSEKEGRKIAEEIKEKKKEKAVPVKKLTLQDLYQQIQKGKLKELKLIVKTDFYGSIDAIKNVISKIPTDEVKISIIHAGTGPVSESDILLASTAEGIVLGFKVPVEAKAKEAAKKYGVEIRTYSVIYELADEIKKAVEGMLEPEEQEILSGQAIVKKVFKLSGNIVVAGCLVVDGKVIRDSIAKVVRNGNIIYEGKLASLKRFKDSVKEVAQNTECGIALDNFNDFKEGDIIQSYIKVKIPKKLS